MAGSVQLLPTIVGLDLLDFFCEKLQIVLNRSGISCHAQLFIQLYPEAHMADPLQDSFHVLSNATEESVV